MSANAPATTTTYAAPKDIAAAVRRILKGAYPTTKFSVRTDRSTGSIRIGWEDGPTAREVEATTAPFKGGHFDGMDDMYHHAPAQNPGTYTNLAVRREMLALAKGATTVALGTRYIFTDRTYSADSYQAALDAINRTNHTNHTLGADGKPSSAYEMVDVPDHTGGIYAAPAMSVYTAAHQYLAAQPR